eukprot:TRINITY_DN886_c2_g2_i1.p1 TRINITY_DN886_c2_g2~~TRINITY_DN886_c2_g2_i1.p1  ORF type:complete len:645 (-),score=276.68 TRINITY_DN886_c2_g2_i1:78-1757(-)
MEEDGGEEGDLNENDSKDLAWGRNKTQLYGRDISEDDVDYDKEEAEEEEEEARRIQSKQHALVDDEFDSAAMFQKSKKSADKPKKSPKKSKFNPNKDEILNDINNKLGLEPNANQIQINRDYSQLSNQEKLEIISNESPEFLGLLNELDQNISKLKNQSFSNLKSKVQNENMSNTTQGVSFLDLQNQLLLNYCINLSFYLLLKASGQSIKNHPVIEELVTLRTYIEKIKPLEKKLDTHLKKLTNIFDLDQSDGKQGKSISKDKNNKPNMNRLTLDKEDDDDEDDDEEDEDEDEDEEDERFKNKKGSKATTIKKLKSKPKLTPTTEIYQPPKRIGKEQSSDRDVTSLHKQLKSNSALNEYVSSHSSAPQLSSNIGSASIYSSSSTDPDALFENAKTQFEEDNFVRLPTTRQDKQREKRVRKKEEIGGSGEDLRAWAREIGGAKGSFEDEEEKKRKEMRREIGKAVRETRESNKRKREEGGGDDDFGRGREWDGEDDGSKRRRGDDAEGGFGWRTGKGGKMKRGSNLSLPVVICLSKRLSHANVRARGLYSRSVEGSLNQL